MRRRYEEIGGDRRRGILSTELMSSSCCFYVVGVIFVSIFR